MTVLLTGFGAFLTHGRNSSELLLRELSGTAGDAFQCCILPVSYTRAADQIIERLAATRARSVVMFGLAASTASLRLEQVARNLSDCPHADNDGQALPRGAIVEDGAATYSSTLPLKQMAALAAELNEPVELSSDAGGYVCNHTFYRVAHHLTQHALQTRCGFVHLPDLAEDAPRLSRFANVVRHWLEIL